MDEPTAAGRIACQRCRHYRITWDPRAPYGCEVHGFKSRRLPSLVVYESSGLECQAFLPKPAQDDGGRDSAVS